MFVITLGLRRLLAALATLRAKDARQFSRDYLKGVMPSRYALTTLHTWVMVLGVGLEPTRPLRTTDFESAAAAVTPLEHINAL